MRGRDAATERQVRAADPANSTWLSANAGSGKTRVLTDRVARLLLDGVEPQNVLCLTYTKAAASEMQNRLFDRLGAWAMMPDGDLAETLAHLGDAPLPADLGHARTLFARAIEAPGGLRIQTIHAFCAGLLRRFPLEAGVSPGFAEMEDRAAALMRIEVVDAMSAGPEAHLVAGIAGWLSDSTLDDFLAEVAGRRAAFADEVDEAALRQALDLAPDARASDLVAQVWTPADAETVRRLVPILRTGGANDAKAADKLARASGMQGLGLLALLESVCLTGAAAASPFSAKIGSFPTKALRNAHAEICEEVEDLMSRVEAARPVRLGLAALAKTRALHDFARAFHRHYAARKLARGLLDFDDLIVRARDLLTDPKVADWVLWRLDGGLDHILVDEAQDTSPDQWAVIEALARELTAGQGARDGKRRTIFVVGDKKQSIYSFQGADPEGFDRMRERFGKALAPPGPGLSRLDLEHSFRSSAAILRVVDETFAAHRRDGLGDPVPHHAFKAAMPGRVDLWPAVEKVKTPEEDRHWTDPVDRKGDRHHHVELAGKIASWLRDRIGTETIPAEIGRSGSYEARPMTEGDVLILVRRRSGLFGEIIRACKAAGLQVAGADRLKVGAELAVRDIAATLRFLALPEDDLSLGAALRSPLFGWSEGALYRLAVDRPRGMPLWARLRAARESHPETLAIVDDLRRQSDFLRPYDLITRLLVRHGGRVRLLARLGPEAEDGIDALLSQALAYERSEVPGLTGFLEWMQADDLEVKRQLDSGGDRIRVMTVHGAKGLESPLVILPDTDIPKRDPRNQIHDEPPALWTVPKAEMPPPLLSRREARVIAEERERRRLLYVAMTRAESWLICCAAGDVGTGEDSWHSMVREGMERGPATALDTPTGDGLRVSHLDWDLPLRLEPLAPVRVKVAPPNFGPLPETGTQLSPLSPTGLGGAKIMPGDVADLDADGDAARLRGSLMHLLLEHLPPVPAPQRRERARAVLAGMEETLSDKAAEALIGDALRLIGAATLGPVFDPSALVEVALTAAPPALGGRRISGTIDRLLVTADSVVAVDFKTNRLVPANPGRVPEGILRQMAAYRAMLSAIYPNRRIEVSILWTATATLMTLPDQLLDAALERVALP